MSEGEQLNLPLKNRAYHVVRFGRNVEATALASARLARLGNPQNNCATDRPMEPKSADRGRATLSAAHTITRFCREKMGWNRIGFLLSVAIIAIAVAVLYHILQGIELGEVLEALRSSDPHNIGLAALFVACAYFTLTFYDLFALRTIGRSDVPYRVAGLGGFTRYSMWYNVGG